MTELLAAGLAALAAGAIYLGMAGQGVALGEAQYGLVMFGDQARTVEVFDSRRACRAAMGNRIGYSCALIR